MSEPGAFEEIPAIPIESSNLINSDFSPIKFTDKNEQILSNESIVDEEITFGKMARKSNSEIVKEEEVMQDYLQEETKNDLEHDLEERLQRKSDDDICNTPKRERHEDQNLNIRSARLLEMDQIISETTTSLVENDVIKTPQKMKNEMIKSLSNEFEHRLASIHVSPRPAVTSGSTMNTNNAASPSVSASKPTRVMSPIRSIAQLSPVSKLNLNDEPSAVEDQIQIETPKLISPSKIVAAASALEIEKIKNDLESKVTLRL